MRYPLIYLIFPASVFLVGGCAAFEPPSVEVTPDPRMTPAELRPDPDTTPGRVVEVKVPVTSPQLRPLVMGSFPATSTGLNAVVQAKAGATTQPSSDKFLNATQYYDYAPGLVYSVITSPGFVTALQLQTGEKLITASAGDTTRWVLEPVESGAGESRQTVLLVKPRRPFLQTNVVITTDQRVYTLDLTSTDQPVYHTLVAWNYPFGDVVAVRNRIAQQESQQQSVIAAGVNLAKVNFNYRILRQKHSDMPSWCPLRTFDDGTKTYIQFPPQILVTQAPPLFVLGAKGDAQIVNYRVKGDYYIVDRLLDRAQLRLGDAPQAVVEIQRAEVK